MGGLISYMTNRIPPSLSWLIDKHARTSGQIIKLRNKLLAVLPSVDKLRELERSLEAIEESLKLHDIQIDLENIRPIRPPMIFRFKFKRGIAQKLVIEFLKSKYGQGPITKTEIDNLIIQEHAKVAPHVICTKGELGRYTHNLLKRLAAKDYIIRSHSKQSHTVGLWEINPKLMSHKLPQ